jgi:dTDP-glucose 4,6-dehydratase
MHAVVTGAAGFLGSHLSETLLLKGWTVTGVDNFITGSRRNLAALNSFDRFHFVEADVIESLPIQGKIDRIYHLASPASPIDYVQLPFKTMYVSSDGTRNCLELALRNQARFFLASTSEVYGDPMVHPQTEEYWGNVNPIGPRSVYDEAKRYAEALAMAYARYKKLTVRIIRIFNTYGPRMRANDGRVIPTFVNQALNNEALTIFGDGEQTRSFCYVDDLIRGMIALMESDLEEPCNIGNTREMTMKELASHINEMTESTGGVIHKPLPKDDPTRRKPNLTRAKTRLGWQPEVPFEEGIAKTIAYFKSIEQKD